MKTTGMILLLVGVAGLAIAGEWTPVVPEINVGSAATAVTLLGGALLVLRSRMKK
jgi:hypothetical protein